ncbi:Heat shock protein ssb1, partial [Balamuthia mandrillaris]
MSASPSPSAASSSPSRQRTQRGGERPRQRRTAKPKKVEAILGIDLGTTITVTYCWIEGQAVPLHIDGETKLPSVVNLRNPKMPVVGERAKIEQGIWPESTVVQAKRLIGHAFADPDIQDDLCKWPFKVVEDPASGNPRIAIGEERYAPEEIESYILKKIKRAVISKTGAEIIRAVITVPAHFNDNQKHATRIAAILAGFDQVRIMTEPVAAALAHDIGIYQEKERKEILVFDLGGGTFDVSLLSLQKTDMGPIFVVKTIEGDSHLGGEDFDNNLVQHVMQAQLADVQWEQGERGRRDMNEFMCQLRSKCEKAKRTLGTEDSVSITLSHLGKDYETREVTLTREVFERINKHLFERCLAIVKSVADTAAAAGTPVGSVIATGGSSQIPYLRERLASIINDAQSHPSASSPSSSSSSSSFPKGTLLKYKDDPDTAVALGACNFAASLWRPYEPTSPKLILIETCPYNIGIAVKGAGGGGGASKASRTTMDIFFERGSTIPATKTFSYTTVYDRQRFAQIAVYEGMDRNDPSANHRLGNFVLEVSEPMPAGQPKIDVKVSLDLDGILTVTAMEKSSKASLEIRACKTTLSAREVRFKKLTSDKDELIDEVDCLQSTLSDKIATLSGKNLEAHIIKAIKKWRNDKDSMEALTELNELCQAEAELQPIQPAIKLLLKQTKYLHSVRSELQELVSLGSDNQALELHYHTIFLVDRSHSMRKKDSCFLDGKVATRFDSVFECILKYLDDRSFTDDTFTMLLFNNKVRTVFKRLKYSPRLEDKIRDIRKKYPPHSTTSFRVAIDKIANVVTQAPEENTVVIMLSDGHDPDFMDACQTLSDLVKNRTTPPVFHAIRFGNSKTTAEALEKLAEAGNGKFSTSKDGI